MSDPFVLLAGVGFLILVLTAAIGLFRRRSNSIIFPVLLIGGCLSLLSVSVWGPDATWSLSLPIYLADARLSFTLDPLSRWFLAIVSGVAIPSILFAPRYLDPDRQKVSLGFVWAGLALLVASMAAVVLAANAIAFLVAWESMALSSFALVATHHRQRSIRHAALVYLGATRIGTAFLMGGFLWAYAATGSWTFSEWHLTGTAALGPALLMLVGLATKAGCWPFHLWLPVAHPAAPAPVSALMSGVMIKTAIYGMLRFFVIDRHLSPPYLGATILTLGAISAVWGILFALLQHDLKRLLAYSSVENIGIILMGIGVALVGRAQGLSLVEKIGIATALFHTLNHSVFKSLMFLGAGAIDAQTHELNAEKLGGLLRRMPWTGAAFLVGSAAICALPPLNGFASEWMLYRGFFGLAMDGGSVGWRLVGLLSMGWLGLVGALAVACFVKVAGVVFLGSPRSQRAANATEAGRSMVASQASLAVACVVLGVTAPVVLRLMAPVVDVAGIWSLPMSAIAVVLGLTTGGIAMLAAWQSRRHPGRRFITWECGFGTLGPRTQYTATSFGQPISRIFGAIYRYAIHVTVGTRRREHFPEVVRVETRHEPYLETRVYRPFLKGIRRTAGGLIMRLQAGSIHQYLVYMFAALALLLAIGVLWQ